MNVWNLNKTMRKRAHSSQRGMALLVGMIMLLALTLIGVAAMQTISLQERMSRNLRDQNFAFQAAEAALRDAEDFMRNNSPFRDFDFTQYVESCDNGYCLPPADPIDDPPRWQEVDWAADSGNSAVAESTLELPGGVASPRYIVELLSGPVTYDPSTGCSIADYRITSVGYGPSGSRVMLQTVYRLKPESC